MTPDIILEYKTARRKARLYRSGTDFGDYWTWRARAALLRLVLSAVAYTLVAVVFVLLVWLLLLVIGAAYAPAVEPLDSVQLPTI